MNYERDRAWAEVSLDRLADNYHKLSEFVGPSCKVLCVIKGNAYGHGAVEVSKELERAGCEILGAATIEEAMELREHGIKLPVLLLGPINPAYAALAAEQGFIVPLIDAAHAEDLSAAAAAAGKTIEAHLKIDTGMSRYGLSVGKDMDGCVAEALHMTKLPNLRVTGVFTHFAVAIIPEEDAFTRRQMTLFRTFSDRMDLEPVMELKARITQIKRLDAGDTIGYGRLFTCERPTTIAIVPFGFVDGIHRAASNKTCMLVNGKPARIVGKICMDLCFLDITDIPDVEEGQVVTLFGWDHGVYQSAYALTNAYPGSAPELTAVLGTRIPRFYLRDGKVVARD